MNITTKKDLAAVIDHTLLDALATRERIEGYCAEAVEYGFHSVCVLGRWVPIVAEILKNTDVKVDGVAGFPFGADTTKIKVADAKDVIMVGADEVDMVADLASVIDGDRKYLINDLKSVLKVCHSMSPKVLLKVIIESAALTDEQIKFVCECCSDVGVDFVKTATGLNPAGGATIEDVRLMAQSAPNCKIKAAGGIRTTDQALAMIEAGASRIGASASVEIINGFNPEQSQ